MVFRACGEDELERMFGGSNGRHRHRDRLSGKPVMYDPLDTEWGGGPSFRPLGLGRWTKRRPTKRVALVLLCVLLACAYGLRAWRAHQAEARRVAEEARRQKELEEKPKPPLFERWHQAELALPQHHVADPFAHGKKYLWVENHVHGELISLVQSANACCGAPVVPRAVMLCQCAERHGNAYQARTGRRCHSRFGRSIWCTLLLTW